MSKYVVTYNQTLPAIGNTIGKTINQELVHGSSDQRAKFFGKLTAEVAIGYASAKGVDKVAKLAKASATAKIPGMVDKVNTYTVKYAEDARRLRLVSDGVGKNVTNKVDDVVKCGSKIVGSSSEVTNLLDKMSGLSGSTREKLLSTVQNTDLKKIVNELYRPGSSVGDGGTASKLVQEFYEGSSTHLTKAQQRLNQLSNLAKSGKLGLNDLDILEALRNDLNNAVNLFK